MIPDILFYLFATLLLAGGAGVVTARNPMHAVLCLVFTFLNAAGLFLLLGAEFLGLLLVMVYVGAIAVMFLFVLMTIDIDFDTLKEGFVKNAPFGLLVGGVLAAELITALVSGLFSGAKGSTLVLSPSLPTTETLPNINQIGAVLFTNYAYPFVAVSMVLLVAMIGAIVLTHRNLGTAKRQKVANQIDRTVEQSLAVVSVPTGKGMAEALPSLNAYAVTEKTEKKD